MKETSLWMVCLQAFTAVMGLLSLLALIMRGLIVLFPEAKSRTDAAVVAAITQAVHTVLPGATVTQIEECR